MLATGSCSGRYFTSAAAAIGGCSAECQVKHTPLGCSCDRKDETVRSTDRERFWCCFARVQIGVKIEKDMSRKSPLQLGLLLVAGGAASCSADASLGVGSELDTAVHLFTFNAGQTVVG